MLLSSENRRWQARTKTDKSALGPSTAAKRKKKRGQAHHTNGHTATRDHKQESSTGPLDGEIGDETADEFKCQTGGTQDFGRVSSKTDLGKELIRIVGNDSGTIHLGEELHRDGQYDSIKHLFSTVFEEAEEICRFAKLLVGSHDGFEILLDPFSVIGILDPREDSFGFFGATFQDQPSRRLGEEEGAGHDEDGEHTRYDPTQEYRY